MQLNLLRSRFIFLNEFSVNMESNFIATLFPAWLQAKCHDSYGAVTPSGVKPSRTSLAWQYAVEAQTSLAPLSWFHGSRVTTACAPMLYISELCEDCALANEIDYAWASIHDNGHVITACDVWLQQRIKGEIRNRFNLISEERVKIF